ncbi:MAG TPA: polyprenol monophosphomannose synthase [Candidatus Angelobacter sp.]|jgi:dolichol-phosphate mannosyltransferase|nr:polyprenol monophosphomannose synthase [Candidatus Angelobacter sp.]
MEPQKLAMVIPTLHEAGNIRELLDRLRRSADPLGVPYELIVVDDDSQDGTEAIVGEMSSHDPRIRLLVRKGARGLAGAVIHGWQNTGASLLGVIDGDLQHPPELLPQMFEALQTGADVVVASRYVHNGSLAGWNAFRQVISRMAIWMTRPLQKAGVRVSDPMSGFFLVRRRCVRDVCLNHQGFKILLDVLVRGNVRSVREIPFVFGQRRAGSSKASVRVAFEYCVLLANLWRERRRA